MYVYFGTFILQIPYLLHFCFKYPLSTLTKKKENKRIHNQICKLVTYKNSRTVAMVT